MGIRKKQKVGTKWFFGQHLVFCHGPIDKLKRIWFGEQIGWDSDVIGNQRIELNKPTLFGAEDKEGGVSGFIDVMFGHKNQAINTYLQQQLSRVAKKPISAYRHLFSLVFNQTYMGNSPYPPTVSAELERIKTGWDGLPIWRADLADTQNGLNAAHIIYELITCTEWGTGSKEIHNEKMVAAAKVLKTEKFGLNLFLDKQQPIEDIVKDICRYINGFVYTDEESGKITLKLVRNDYAPDLLRMITGVEIRTARNVRRRALTDAVNTLTITYTDPDTYQKASVVVRNSALLAIARKPIAETVNFPMIHDAKLAQKIGMRELKLLSTQLMTFDLYCDETCSDLQPGDVIKVDYPDAGLNKIIARVQKKRRGPINNPEVRLTCVEDIFSPTFGRYTPPGASSWKQPDSIPLPVTNQLVIEAPFWWLHNHLEYSQLNSLNEYSGVLLWQGFSPSSAAMGVAINYSNTNDWLYSHNGIFSPSITLNGDLKREISEVDIDLFGNSKLDINELYLVGGEIFAIQKINGHIVTLLRGVLDTHPLDHAKGSCIYTISDEPIHDEFLQGETVHVKAATYTHSSQLELSKSVESRTLLNARAIRPLPVCNVLFNGVYWPEKITLPINISWSLRNRLSQTVKPNKLQDWKSTGQAESNSEVIVKVSDDAGSIQEYVISSTAAQQLTINKGQFTGSVLHVEIKSKRDSWESFNNFTHTLSVS